MRKLETGNRIRVGRRSFPFHVSVHPNTTLPPTMVQRTTPGSVSPSHGELRERDRIRAGSTSGA
jgi:hypothetical protein